MSLIFVGLIFTLVSTVVQSEQGQQDVVQTFLDDGNLANSTPRSVPIDLGMYEYECLGNIRKCPDGLTIGMWFKPEVLDRSAADWYVMSSGGQSLLSEGMYARQSYPNKLEVGVSLGNRTWIASFKVIPNLWLHLSLTWAPKSGLNVYVGSKPTGSDPIGSYRVSYLDQFDPFPNVVIGGANDAVPGGSIGDSSKMAVWDVRFINRVYTEEEIKSLMAKASADIDIPSCTTVDGTNVTNLEDDTVFGFTVDMGVTPAMPYSVEIDYDNGQTAVVEFGGKNSTASGATGRQEHRYRYGKYGIYRVRCTVKNSISSVVLPPFVVQVGQNITLVDVYTNETRVKIGQPVGLRIHSPMGSPVALTVDMGDGNTFALSRPVTYSPSDNQLVVTAPQGKPMDISNWSISPSRDFHVTYRYTKSGQYTIKVNATNIFSTAGAYLCPDITVVSAGISTAPCSVTMYMPDHATEINPLVHHRSDEIVISATATLTCSPSAGTSYIPAYTWTVERLMSDNSWRPEQEVCATNLRSSNLTISPNTLWYGVYRLTVTAAVVMRQHGAERSTLSKAVSKSTYLKVVPLFD